jgi:DNA-binding transcriptional ArsR family regulator
MWGGKKPTTSTGGKLKPERCRVFSIDPKRVRLGRKAILDEFTINDIAQTFKMLAHPTRVRIIQALTEGELCVCEISEVISLSVSATSHQLNLLRTLRLVRARFEGKLVFYTLSDPFVVSLLKDCANHFIGKGNVGLNRKNLKMDIAESR